MMIGSILTGVPVQINSGGSLSEAGSQELGWCHQFLKEMDKKKKDYCMVDSFFRLGKNKKWKLTKKMVLEHKGTIENYFREIKKQQDEEEFKRKQKGWWQFWK